jgi:hypothetical protein
MKITRRQIDGGVERLFLTGAIVSDQFLREAASFYDPDLLETRYVRTVAEWCFRYFQKYDKAPGISIKDIWESHQSRQEPTERELIGDLLASLSEEYERSDKMNVQYMLDQVEKHFKTLSLARLTRTVNGLTAEGEVAEAEAELANYKRVGRPTSLGTNPFTDAEGLQRAFEQADAPLFTLPGKLGRMINRVLNRDQFISFLGPEKRGKTWLLNEIAIRAAKARCNVALFQVGDMSEEQVKVRLSVRLAGKSNLKKYVGEQDIPVPDCRKNQEGSCRKCPHRNKPVTEAGKWDIRQMHEIYQSGAFANHEPCTECINDVYFKGSVWYRTITIEKPLTWRESWKINNRFLGRIKGRDFRLHVSPSDQLTVADIKGILDNWEMFDAFVPDVIVIDYADNLAPENSREEPRHQINRIWKALRGLSQERHCLVATATQAAARSYKKESIEMDDYSEDKRKYAHVTGCFGLNQAPEEKRAGLMRLNTIVLREDEFYTDDEVFVGQALRVGRHLLFSF